MAAATGADSSKETQREFISPAQAPLLRVPLADGTLVPTPERAGRSQPVLNLAAIGTACWHAGRLRDHATAVCRLPFAER